MSLQSRIADLLVAIGADIKLLQTARDTYEFSMTGALATKVGGFKVYMEGDYVLDTVRASVGTAPTAGTVVVDVNRNGTTVYTTQANRPTIATSGFTALGGAAANDTFSAGDYLTVDVDTVGTSSADLTVVVRLRRIS